MLRVNEIFGPTIQGEGPHAGKFCGFLRMANCNLTCRWCDTSYTWAFTPAKAKKHDSGRVWSKAEQIIEMSPAEAYAEIQNLYTRRLVISGGEPLLQAKALVPLVKELRKDHEIDIETAGTLPPGPLRDLIDTFIVSPKLSNSGNELSKRFKEDVLREFASSHIWPKTYFKFVVQNYPIQMKQDFEEIDGIVRDFGILRDHVYIMPEGRIAEEVTAGAKAIVEDTLRRGYNLSLRSHVYIWGDLRGH